MTITNFCIYKANQNNTKLISKLEKEMTLKMKTLFIVGFNCHFNLIFEITFFFNLKMQRAKYI